MRSLILLTAMAVLTVGCGGDDPVEPVDTSYSFTVTVVDAGGDPIEGVNVNIVNDVFIDLDKAGAPAVESETRVTLPVQVLKEALVRVMVRDIDGVTVRRLDDRTMLPGRHFVDWDGRDDDGAALPSGRYTLAAIAFPLQGSTPYFSGEVDAFLKRPGDSFVLGVTGSTGRYRTTEQSILPGLFVLPDMIATDASGSRTGILEIQETATVTVWRDGEDPVSDAIAISYGPNAVTIVYDPPSASAVFEAPSPLLVVPVGDASKDDDPIWKLGDPYPNPFS